MIMIPTCKLPWVKINPVKLSRLNAEPALVVDIDPVDS